MCRSEGLKRVRSGATTIRLAATTNPLLRLKKSLLSKPKLVMLRKSEYNPRPTNRHGNHRPTTRFSPRDDLGIQPIRIADVDINPTVVGTTTYHLGETTVRALHMLHEQQPVLVVRTVKRPSQVEQNSASSAVTTNQHATYQWMQETRMNHKMQINIVQQFHSLMLQSGASKYLIRIREEMMARYEELCPYVDPFWESFVADALRTIMREEGCRALYRGMGPGLLLVSHGAIQFTVYEELRKLAVGYKSKGKTDEINGDNFFFFERHGDKLLVIRARLQQRPNNDGIQRYKDSLHVLKDTVRWDLSLSNWFEGFRGFYKGITPNLLKNVPAASITFVVYENVLSLLKRARTRD
ncbi:hypothetical protein GIB67_004813 [Kingdonia uniflora]|uniref:Uncharacterized protein n=1 Tax=Kingdonia uniflora TaxID=39325 RepID=A0A7J7LNM2_9MAGN|nr:hypothetical protein GIB67_004813 [Kingdonia uniflora]